jgi:hypothetical protein
MPADAVFTFRALHALKAGTDVTLAGRAVAAFLALDAAALKASMLARILRFALGPAEARYAGTLQGVADAAVVTLEIFVTARLATAEAIAALTELRALILLGALHAQVQGA